MNCEPLRNSATAADLATAHAKVGIIGGGSLANAIAQELRRRGLGVASNCEVDSLAGVSAAFIVSESDADNVDLALRAQGANPDLRIVVRLFDAILEDYLEKTAPNIRVLSMSAVASPVVVALLDAETAREVSESRVPRHDNSHADAMLPRVVAFVCAVLVVGTMYFAHAMHLSLGDAFYFVTATITTTGYGDITPKEFSAWVKFATSLLMLVGTGSFAVLFALMTDRLFALRLERTLGRVRTRLRGHMLLAGSGNMTLRIAALLRARDVAVIVVEQDPNARSLPALRAAGHHVVIGDATREETLAIAGVEYAKGIVALTDSDASNLQIALTARTFNGAATVLARIDSPLLCDHIEQDRGIDAFSPVALAARAFVDAAT